tara:strand:- start:526 stop:678 length:153 start_codon:yes stop_codon:yes gene_type:complete
VLCSLTANLKGASSVQVHSSGGTGVTAALQEDAALLLQLANSDGSRYGKR